jgi:MFS family permease
MFGVGAVVCSLLLSRIYNQYSRHTVINISNVTHGIAIVIIAVTNNLYIAGAAMLLAGLSWTALVTSITIVAQMLLPRQIRARGLSINMMVMMGMLALGSVFWGKVAEIVTLSQTYLIAGLIGVAVPLLTQKFPIAQEVDNIDHHEGLPTDKTNAEAEA